MQEEERRRREEEERKRREAEERERLEAERKREAERQRKAADDAERRVSNWHVWLSVPSITSRPVRCSAFVRLFETLTETGDRLL